MPTVFKEEDNRHSDLMRTIIKEDCYMELIIGTGQNEISVNLGEIS